MVCTGCCDDFILTPFPPCRHNGVCGLLWWFYPNAISSLQTQWCVRAAVRRWTTSSRTCSDGSPAKRRKPTPARPRTAKPFCASWSYTQKYSNRWASTFTMVISLNPSLATVKSAYKEPAYKELSVIRNWIMFPKRKISLVGYTFKKNSGYNEHISWSRWVPYKRTLLYITCVLICSILSLN